MSKAKIHRNQVKMEVRIGLEPEDREPLVKDMLKYKNEVDKLRIDAKDTQAVARKAIKEAEAQFDEVCASLARGKRVLRDVEIIKNFSSHKVKIKDLETGRFIEERDMTKDDLQMSVGEGEDPEGMEEAAQA